jgi:hypothetical protein
MTSIVVGDIKARVYGDTAIVWGHTTKSSWIGQSSDLLQRGKEK